MNVWNKEDMCRTDAFGCSAKPARIIWTWSAIWHEVSWGIGWLIMCPELAPWMAVCVNEPSNNHDNNLMWLMHSTNSFGLNYKKKCFFALFMFGGSNYVCWLEVLQSQGRYLVIALLSLPFPLVISSAKYCAMPHFIIPPKVSSFKPTIAPLQ